MPQSGIAPPEVMDLKQRLIEYVREHEQGCTTTGQPGTPCWGERCSLIAFLCHGLGIRPDRLYREVSPRVADLDARCGDPNCKHEQN